jgi:hypothetical protein
MQFQMRLRLHQRVFWDFRAFLLLFLLLLKFFIHPSVEYDLPGLEKDIAKIDYCDCFKI